MALPVCCAARRRRTPRPLLQPTAKRLNLAITLERAGREGDATAAYTAALEVYPDYLPAIQGLARQLVRTGGWDERLDGWLREIAMRSTDPSWREWAQRTGHATAR